MKIDKANLAIIILALLALVLFWLALNKNKQTAPANADLNPKPAKKEAPIWETKIDDRGEVIIAVTPPNFSRDESIWKFNIAMDTHSVELDNDLTKDATLITGGDKEFQPTGWAGAGPGGHHREGALLFNSLQPLPAYVKLKIRNVGGIPERQFRWERQ